MFLLMKRTRPGQGRKLLPVMLLAGCSAPEAPCMQPSVNDAGMRCGCLPVLQSDNKLHDMAYCDPDIGNPCDLGCANGREADGGRRYMDGHPVCFC